MLKSSERLTYTQMRVMDIERKLLQINPNMKEADTVDIINTALAVFSYICDAHIDKELEHGELIHDIIDEKQDFVYNVNSLIYETREQNHVLNEYIDKKLNLNKEVKK